MRQITAPAIDLSALLAALAQTDAALDVARTLPGAVYTDAAIEAREHRELYARNWIAIARAEDMPHTGSFVTHEVADERVLVARAEDGVLRAFYNVCRHRGARLVDEASGTLRDAIACPYHAWTYALDGRFRRAPRMQAVGQEDALALERMPLAQRDGFVFVQLDPQAPAFAAWAAQLPDFTAYRLDALRRVRRLEYDVEANWKIVCENYSECYHCPLVHPQLNRIGDITRGGFESGSGYNGGPMVLRDGFTTLSMSGMARAPLLRGTQGEGDSRVFYYLVYPNLMLGIHPDYLLTHTVWPLVPQRSRVVCELFFAPEALADPAFDAADAIDFWDLTNRQDWALCARVQQGVASRGYRPGPYHPSERCVHAFDRWYAQWLRQSLAAAPPVARKER